MLKDEMKKNEEEWRGVTPVVLNAGWGQMLSKSALKGFTYSSRYFRKLSDAQIWVLELSLGRMNICT